MNRVIALRAACLCGGVSMVVLSGCASTGHRVTRADNPQTVTKISKFELAADEVVVHGRVRDCTSKDESLLTMERLAVRPGECFVSGGLNCIEWWTLETIAQDEATFDVRGKYYSCADPFAIWFGIPSRTSHWTVRVCRPGVDGAPASGERPDWFQNLGKRKQ